MSKPMKVCRVCGKQYAACSSIRTGSAVFNWREVACSPECGQAYLKRVKDSREKQNTSFVSKAKKADKKESLAEVVSEDILQKADCECE